MPERMARLWPALDAVAEHAQHRVLRLQGHQLGAGVVGRGVVHEHHLEGAPVEGGGDLADQGGDIAGLVMHGHDNGEFGCVGQRLDPCLGTAINGASYRASTAKSRASSHLAAGGLSANCARRPGKAALNGPP
jgi:hypothetical protein